jgi:hypothetical protein
MDLPLRAVSQQRGTAKAFSSLIYLLGIRNVSYKVLEMGITWF